MSLKQNPFLLRVKTDRLFRTLVTAACSAGFIFIYGFYNGFLGIMHHSLWYGSVSIYYLLLAVMKATIVMTERRSHLMPEADARALRHKVLCATVALLLVMNLSLNVPTMLMAFNQRPVEIGLIFAIAHAIYTTYKIIAACIHLKQTKGNVLICELRHIQFVDALVSVLILENTLILAVNAEDFDAMKPVIILSSIVILFLAFFTSLRFAIRAMRGKYGDW